MGGHWSLVLDGDILHHIPIGLQKIKLHFISGPLGVPTPGVRNS
jgi:hypothetical protein